MKGSNNYKNDGRKKVVIKRKESKWWDQERRDRNEVIKIKGSITKG